MRMTIEEIEQAFSAAMAEQGFGDHDIPADGEWHRFAFPDNKPGKSSGSAILNIGDRVAGTVIDFRRSEKSVFKWTPSGPVDPEVAAAHRARASERTDERKARRERVRAESFQLYATLPEATRDHPYLARKGIKNPHSLKLDGDALVVPIFSAATGEFQAIQRIWPDGKKLFPEDATVKNGFMFVTPRSWGFDIDKRHPQKIVIAEGYATAAAIYSSTLCLTAAAFSCNNLAAVAKAVRGRYPLIPIVIAADDETKAGKSESPGVEAACAAAREVSFRVKVALPSRKDFGDVFVEDGETEVQKQIDAAVDPPPAWRSMPRELIDMLESSGDGADAGDLLRAFLRAALNKGIDESDIIAACLDPSLAGGAIHDHVEQSGGREYAKRQIELVVNKPAAGAGDKVVIYLTDGDLFKAWRETQRALLKHQLVFVRGNALVEALWRFETEDGGEVLVAQFEKYNALRLGDVAARHAVEFMKMDLRRKKWVRVDPPKNVIDTLLYRGDWDFPSVVGIVTSPTLRPDGSLLDRPGYDPATKLWYKPAADVALPPIPERPTKEQAREALAELSSLLDGFPFDGEPPESKTSVARSVALAGMLTTVLRGAVPVAPMFAVVAPDPRTGKSFLVCLIGVLATGHRPVPTAAARNQEEFEKRVETAALSGRAIIHLNNLPNGMVVESERLSEMSTENRIHIRKLGRHEEGLCDCRGTTIFMNGNNIVIAADLVPRTPVCRLDAKTEHPEARTFTFDPIERVRQDRGKYLAAVFTIARAFIAAGSPAQDVIRVAGFEAWSRLVQQPLMWLEQPDPLGSMEDARALDPTREELRRLLDVLKKYFPAEQFFTVAVCERLAEEQVGDSMGRPYYKHQDLRNVMTFHGKINVVSFGMMIKRHRDRVLDGWSIRVVAKMKQQDPNSYYLEGPPAQHAEVAQSASASEQSKPAQSAEAARSASERSARPEGYYWDPDVM